MDDASKNASLLVAAGLKRRPDLDAGIYVTWELPDGTVLKFSTDQAIKEFLETTQ
jgi:hypothetical protein